MIKLAANLNLTEGKQVKSNQSVVRAGPKSKKSAGRSSPFAEIAMQMAAVANTMNSPAASVKSSGSNLRVGAGDGKVKPEATGKAGEQARQAMADLAAQETPAKGTQAFSRQLNPDIGSSVRGQEIIPNETGSEASGAQNAKGGSEIKVPKLTVNAADGLSANGPENSIADDKQGRSKVNAPAQANTGGQKETEGDGEETKLNKDQTRVGQETKFTSIKTDPGSIQGMAGETNRVEITPPKSNTAEESRYVLTQNQKDTILDQMVQQIKTAPSSIELQLKPEILGNVNILVESKEGAITISIAAQNSETANMLNSNLANMRSYLEQQGINLQQMEVNLGYRENRDQSAHSDGGDNRSAFNPDLPVTELNNGDYEPDSSWRSRAGLNILA